MSTARLTYQKLKLPSFIPSITESAFDLSRLLPYIINAIQVSKYSSIMLSVHDLLYGKLLPKYSRKMIDQGEDLRKCFNFAEDTIIFLDSGGLESVNRYGRLVWEDPFEVYAFQKRANADVWVILDYPTQKEVGREENKKRIDQTVYFAIKINQIHDLPASLMAVAHGYDRVSLIKCVTELAKLEKAQVIAIPLWFEPFGSDIGGKLKTVLQIKKEIGKDKFIHLLGCGSMRMWPLYVLCGANSMDATDWLAYTANPERLTWTRYPSRVKVRCNCRICKGKIVDDICKQDPVSRLQHNLFFTEQVMDEIRERLYMGTLTEYIKKRTPEYTKLVEALEKEDKVGV